MTVTLSEWTTALRSGEYEQGIGCLITKNKDGSRSYCCLGVYEKLRADQGLAEIRYRTGRNRYEVISGYGLDNTSEYTLTDPARKELGFDHANPQINFDSLIHGTIGDLVYDPRDDYRDLYWSLASLNDGGLTFSQMADVIDYFFGGEK